MLEAGSRFRSQNPEIEPNFRSEVQCSKKQDGLGEGDAQAQVANNPWPSRRCTCVPVVCMCLMDIPGKQLIFLDREPKTLVPQFGEYMYMYMQRVPEILAIFRDDFPEQRGLSVAVGL